MQMEQPPTLPKSPMNRLGSTTGGLQTQSPARPGPHGSTALLAPGLFRRGALVDVYTFFLGSLGGRQRQKATTV